MTRAEATPRAADAELVNETKAALRAMHEAQELEAKAERAVGTARQAAAQRRLEVGRVLLRARERWPQRGPNARGWGEYLLRVGLDDATARRYIELAGGAEFSLTNPLVSEKTYTGSGSGPQLALVPAPADESGCSSSSDDRAALRAKLEAAASDRDDQGEDEDSDGDGCSSEDSDDDGYFARRARFAEGGSYRERFEELYAAVASGDKSAVARLVGKANVNGGSGEVDRGSWCTPRAWASRVGPMDVDPFSNPRSHVAATARCMLEDGGDGLVDGAPAGRYRVGPFVPGAIATVARAATRVWLQPPYDIVDRAIAHYGHTRFVALLRFAPDTKWFQRLFPLTRLICFPLERLAFEPPPGVESSGGAPYPHALYYARAEDATREVLDACAVWRVR